MASGKYRRQWHKYLPLAVLNYNTTYHSSIGCEPSKVFHVRIQAAPLQEKDYCFVLKPKADCQGSKIPFRDFKWTGRFVVQKVLPNNNYIVRRLNTNKTQILHIIRLKKFVPNAH